MRANEVHFRTLMEQCRDLSIRRLSIGHSALMLLAVCAVIGGSSLLVRAQVLEPAAGPEGVAAQQSIPTTDEEIQALRDALAAEIKELQPKVTPRSPLPEGETAESEAARIAPIQELLDALKAYDAQLAELRDLRAQVAANEGNGASTQLSEALTAIQQNIERVKNDRERWRDQVSDEELKQAEVELETARADAAARTKAKEERDLRMREYPARKEALAREVEAKQASLLAVKGEHEAKLAAATNEAEREQAMQRLRKAQTEASLAQVRQQRLELENRRDSQLSIRSEQWLPAVRDLVQALERRLDRFKYLKSRSQIQWVLENTERVNANQDTVSKYEVAFWNAWHAMLNAQQEVSRLRWRMGLRDRFPKDTFEELKQDLQRELDYWAPLIESVEGRASERIEDFYQRIGVLIASRRAQRARKTDMYYDVLDQRARVIDRMEALEDEEVAPRLRRIVTLAQDEPDSEKRARLTTELQTHRTAFYEEREKVRESLNALVERLRNAIALLGTHADALTALQSRLYWSYLRVQDQPIWRFRIARVRDEWTAEAAERQRALEPVIAGFERVTPRLGMWMALALVASLVTGALARLRLRRSAVALESRIAARLQESSKTVAPLSDRLHLQLIRFFARTALVVWPAAVAWVCVRFLTPLDGRVTGTLLVMLGVAGVCFALVSTLFSRSKPRYRLVPCSNVVASHYRRFLHLFLWMSVVVLPAPIYLGVFDLAPYTQMYPWAAYKILALLLVLVFLMNRQAVLRAMGRPDSEKSPLLVVLISGLYPLLYLSILALLIVQVLGYGPLCNYIMSGAVRTVGTIILAVLVARYLRDLAGRYGARLAEVRKATESDTEEQERAAVLASRDGGGEPEKGDDGLWVRMAGSVIRWGVYVFALVKILGYWGVSQVDLKRVLLIEIVGASPELQRPAITVGRSFMAVAILVISWIVSRGIRSFLDTRIFPSYSAMDRGGRAAVSTLLHYVLVLFGLYFALYTMRIPLGALTVVLGTLGLGLGLGLQPLFVNFLSGLVILFERHVKVGDVVDLNGTRGEVTAISMRATSIKTPDNIDMVIPNSEFVSGKVVNCTLDDPRQRGKLTVGIAYGSDVRLVQRLLLQVAQEDELVLSNPPPIVCFSNFGESSLDFELYVWCNNLLDRWMFLSNVRYRIVELFKEHNIEIPFPQQTISTPDGQPLTVRVFPSEMPRTETSRSLPDLKAPG